LMPISGSGTSSNQRPTVEFLLTNAFMMLIPCLAIYEKF
jgi:hypothetical protein